MPQTQSCLVLQKAYHGIRKHRCTARCIHVHAYGCYTRHVPQPAPVRTATTETKPVASCLQTYAQVDQPEPATVPVWNKLFSQSGTQLSVPSEFEQEVHHRSVGDVVRLERALDLQLHLPEDQLDLVLWNAFFFVN